MSQRTLEGPKGGRADWGVDKAVDICKSGFCSSENILISDFIQGIITSFIDFLFFFSFYLVVDYFILFFNIFLHRLDSGKER